MFSPHEHKVLKQTLSRNSSVQGVGPVEWFFDDSFASLDTITTSEEAGKDGLPSCSRFNTLKTSMY